MRAVVAAARSSTTWTDDEPEREFVGLLAATGEARVTARTPADVLGVARTSLLSESETRMAASLIRALATEVRTRGFASKNLVSRSMAATTVTTMHPERIFSFLPHVEPTLSTDMQT